MSEKAKLEKMADTLATHPDYRVLRRLDAPDSYADAAHGEVHKGIFLDTETTGLDTASVAVIELCMVPFSYDDEGRILKVDKDNTLSELHDPGFPIPPEVSDLTGISDEMVKGHAIDPERVVAIAADADIVIAHNASFDRPITERHWPVFSELNWGCSLRDIDWKAQGQKHASLEALAANYGVFFDAHRADADCFAGIHVLAQNRRDPNTGKDDGTLLSELLATSGACSYIVRAIGSPFEKKDLLKSRGYRWHDGKSGKTKHWYAQVGEDALEAEKKFLFREVYGRERDIPIERQSANTRYSARV